MNMDEKTFVNDVYVNDIIEINNIMANNFVSRISDSYFDN